ncbi:hypothetical protein ABCS02_08505 [Microbacterium sp. X-17]|uniref:hypothetical protein n=1 Tax=Microbacterium sp. X-17 TaxID=3144404 RepID=UPI0031F54B43
MSTPFPNGQDPRPTRRTIVGAAAWAAPAIALTTASPAYAASTPGVIAFLDPEDLIGSGHTARLAVQLTPAPGEQLPASVSVRYGTPGVVDGPVVVATGGAALVTIPVTGLDTNGSTTITVSAPGYLPATTTLAVTFDDGLFYMARNAPFGVTSSYNTLTPTTSHGVRAIANDGTITDTWTGTWQYASTGASNTFTPTGTLFGGGFGNPAFLRGGVDWRMEAHTTASPNLVWQKQDGFAFSGMPIGGTHQSGRTSTGDGFTVMKVVPAVRATRSTAASPGGTAIFVWTFPRFPAYRAAWLIDY